MYSIYLLELIAYRLSPGNKEFNEWRKSVMEDYIATTATAEVSEEAAQPEPLQARRDEPKQEPEAGVRNTFGEKLSAAWKSKK